MEAFNCSISLGPSSSKIGSIHHKSDLGAVKGQLLFHTSVSGKLLSTISVALDSRSDIPDHLNEVSLWFLPLSKLSFLKTRLLLAKTTTENM
jgi:hypothetical protein